MLSIQTDGDQHGELILQLLRQNAGFIRKTARPFIRLGAVTDEAELMSIGFLAMSSVVRYYRCDRAQSEGAFLALLRAQLLTELMSALSSVLSAHIPDDVLRMVSEMQHASERLSELYGRQPTDTEIAHALGLTVDKVQSLKKAANGRYALSLDAPVQTETETEGITLADIIADDATDIEYQCTESALRNEMRMALTKELSALPESQAKAIRRKYYDGLPVDDRSAYNRGMRTLRQPQVRYRLADFIAENLYTGTGLKNFKHTESSAPERIAINRLNER